MQKISSLYQFNLKIQQILGSHELKGYGYPKIIEATFSFPEFVASVCSNCSFLRYIQFQSLSGTRFYQTYIMYRNTVNNINFHYRTNSVKLKTNFFIKFKKALFLTQF